MQKINCSSNGCYFLALMFPLLAVNIQHCIKNFLQLTRFLKEFAAKLIEPMIIYNVQSFIQLVKNERAYQKL